MNKVIVRCSCGGVKTKMDAAMQVLAPGEPLPPEYKGSDAIRKFMAEHPNTNLSRHLEAVVKKHGRYCYYIEYNDAGDITDMRDLMTGRRLY